MEILRASMMGYCMGVKRAIECAENALVQYPEKSVYTFGPLIHNKVALQSLSQRGLKVLDSSKIDEFDGSNSIVIIRAHGISPALRRVLEAKGSVVLDATCPRVLSSHKRANSFSADGFTVIIAGDKNHGEVTGIEGVVQDNGQQCIVLENSQQAKAFVPETGAKYVILSQTTFSPFEYSSIVDELKSKISNISILNTICSATEERQKALHSLCEKCDCLLVVGGKESANTRRLFEIADEHAKDEKFRVQKAFYLEDYSEFLNSKSQILSQVSKDSVIGITAGASTPEESVEKIEIELNRP